MKREFIDRRSGSLPESIYEIIEEKEALLLERYGI